MYNELSKSQKKIARMLINKGLEIECTNCIEKVKSLISSNTKGEKTNHALYGEIYKLIHKFDKHLGNRYDNITGSTYFIIVLGLYMDDIISDEDIADFDEDIRHKLIGLKQEFKQ
jgi:hypothetical protein